MFKKVIERLYSMKLTKNDTKRVYVRNPNKILKDYFFKNKEKTVVKKYEIFRFIFSHKGMDSDFSDEEFDKEFPKKQYAKEEVLA